jgi:hypothetical protein
MPLAAWFQLIGPRKTVQIFGVRFVGVDWFNAKRLLFTLVLILAVVVISKALKTIARVLVRGCGRLGIHPNHDHGNGPAPRRSMPGLNSVADT